MFYSHSILTSREHGVATVWLVATLGSKSTLRTVTRKKILDVDVNKACNTIQNPQAPMALRLQGNLLYGVARVYSQQCGYVLADAQAVRDKVRGVAMLIKELALDPEAGRARPDQLNLPDDPAFMPELDLNFDLSAFDQPLQTSGRSSLMSPPSLVSSRSSQQAAEEEVEEPILELPSGDSSLGAGLAGFDLGFGAGISSIGRTPGPSVLGEETGIVDVGWEFDEHGNMIDTAQAPKSPTAAPSARDLAASRLQTDSAISASVRQEHAEGLHTAQQAEQGLEFDDGNLAFGDDEHALPEARPFSPREPTVPVGSVQASAITSAGQSVEEETASTSISAPHRRARTAKPLDFDETPGLTNAELRQWNEGYLENMQGALASKNAHKLAHQAKKNAEHWVLGQGIGGVGSGLGQDHASGPLQMFSGTTLLAAVTGRELSPAGTKHARSASVASVGEEEERRVRAREEEGEQIGRGAVEQDLTLAGQDEVVFVDDEMEIEVGRTAPEDLPEGRSSQMPWDFYSASRQGSMRPFGSAAAGMTSSGGGPSRGFELGPLSLLSRRGSRLTTASPLQGRGPRLPLSQRISFISTPDRAGLTTSGGRTGGEDDEMLGLDLPPPAGDESEDFQLYGPAATVDTQTAAHSRWIAAALDSESRNFLDFLDAQIQAQLPLPAAAEAAAEGEDEDEPAESSKPKPKPTATFEGLLPHGEHSRVVAAQAFLHVLTLASKNLVRVEQEEGFGAIELAIAVEA